MNDNSFIGTHRDRACSGVLPRRPSRAAPGRGRPGRQTAEISPGRSVNHLASWCPAQAIVLRLGGISCIIFYYFFYYKIIIVRVLSCPAQAILLRLGGAPKDRGGEDAGAVHNHIIYTV